MTDPIWVLNAGVITGSIGAVTGIAGAILGYVGYGHCWPTSASCKTIFTGSL